MDRLPDGGPLWALRGGTAGKILWFGDFAELGHVLDWNLYLQVEELACASVDDGDRAIARSAACGLGLVEGDLAERGRRCGGVVMGLCDEGGGFGAAEEAGYLFEGTLRRGEADALEAATCEGLQTLDGEGHVRAALGGDERVDLVEDDGLDGAEGFACFGGEEEIEGFGRGDEDVAGMTAEARAVLGRGVAGADANLGHAEGDAFARGHVGDALQRRAQVAFHVDGERLERRDVDDAATMRSARRCLHHEAVDAPEEGGERLAGSGWGEDQGGVAAGDRRPAFALRRGWGVEDGAEPGSGEGMEEREGGVVGGGCGIDARLRRWGGIGGNGRLARSGSLGGRRRGNAGFGGDSRHGRSDAPSLHPSI